MLYLRANLWLSSVVGGHAGNACNLNNNGNANANSTSNTGNKAPL